MSEQSEDGSCGDAQVDAVYRRGSAEALDQAAGDDGVRRGGCR
jgi:hypothetical protein